MHPPGDAVIPVHGSEAAAGVFVRNARCGCVRAAQERSCVRAPQALVRLRRPQRQAHEQVGKHNPRARAAHGRAAPHRRGSPAARPHDGSNACCPYAGATRAHEAESSRPSNEFQRSATTTAHLGPMSASKACWGQHSGWTSGHSGMAWACAVRWLWLQRAVSPEVFAGSGLEETRGIAAWRGVGGWRCCRGVEVSDRRLAARQLLAARSQREWVEQGLQGLALCRPRCLPHGSLTEPSGWAGHGGDVGSATRGLW
jgi:hypothetical protein